MLQWWRNLRDTWQEKRSQACLREFTKILIEDHSHDEIRSLKSRAIWLKNIIDPLIRYRAGSVTLFFILIATAWHQSAFFMQSGFGTLTSWCLTVGVSCGLLALNVLKSELVYTQEQAWMARVGIIVLFIGKLLTCTEAGFFTDHEVTFTLRSVLDIGMLEGGQWLVGTVLFPIFAYMVTDNIAMKSLLAKRDEACPLHRLGVGERHQTWLQSHMTALLRWVFASRLADFVAGMLLRMIPARYHKKFKATERDDWRENSSGWKPGNDDDDGDTLA